MIDGGGCSKKTRIEFVPRRPYPKPTFQIVDVLDYKADDPTYLDNTYTNKKFFAGKVKLRLPHPVDTTILDKYRVFRNAGWNKYEPSLRSRKIGRIWIGRRKSIGGFYGSLMKYF